MTTKPFSQACENNKQPILEQLRNLFTDKLTVLEIGSGTGQHACYFAEKLPHILWQPSDKPENLPGIQQWLKASGLLNILPPIRLDVTDEYWPVERIEGLFTANTLHIMAWPEIEFFFGRLKSLLVKNALCCIYGPFNYGGSYTSESNAKFDQWLHERNPLSAIRDVEAVICLANAADMELLNDIAMPSNNRLLVLRKI